MERVSDVIVVSCFGRGHWLASSLAQRGMLVTLLDVSETVGHWAAEDWEGPFGVLRSEALLPLQKARLMDDAYLVDVENGFTVWSEQGVVELKGPLTQYRLEKLGLAGPTADYIATYDSLGDDGRRALFERVRGASFAQNWLAQLAHQLASTVYFDNSAALSWGRPLPLFAPWSLRRATRRGYEDALRSYQRAGVRVLSQAQILDIDVIGRAVHGVEVRSEWSGIVRGRNLVWMLTSEESQRVHEKVHKSLFPKGAMLADWSWMRYRLEFAANPVTAMLPLGFVILGDKHLPWAHANMMLVLRTERETAFDVWVRVPIYQRFQRPYLENMGEDILAQLRKRLPQMDLRILDMPQEYNYDYAWVGAPRFPVYPRPLAGHLTTFAGSNVYFDGPEHWQSLDWTGQLRSQGPIEKALVNWWLKEEQQAKDVRRGRELGD